MISVGVFWAVVLFFSIEVEPAIWRLSPGMEVEPTHVNIMNQDQLSIITKSSLSSDNKT